MTRSPGVKAPQDQLWCRAARGPVGPHRPAVVCRSHACGGFRRTAARSVVLEASATAFCSQSKAPRWVRAPNPRHWCDHRIRRRNFRPTFQGSPDWAKLCRKEHERFDTSAKFRPTLDLRIRVSSGNPEHRYFSGPRGPQRGPSRRGVPAGPSFVELCAREPHFAAFACMGADVGAAVAARPGRWRADGRPGATGYGRRPPAERGRKEVVLGVHTHMHCCCERGATAGGLRRCCVRSRRFVAWRSHLNARKRRPWRVSERPWRAVASDGR